MIYVECKPDYTLVKILGLSKKEIRHEGGKSKICNRLRKSSKSKGLVDEDPLSTQHPYIKTLRLLSDKDDIKVLYSEKAQNHIFVLCPRLEEWILKIAKIAKVDPEKYGLPNDANELHKIININLGKFAKLIEALKKKSKILKNLENLIMGRER